MRWVIREEVYEDSFGDRHQGFVVFLADDQLEIDTMVDLSSHESIEVTPFYDAAKINKFDPNAEIPLTPGELDLLQWLHRHLAQELHRDDIIRVFAAVAFQDYPDTHVKAKLPNTLNLTSLRKNQFITPNIAALNTAEEIIDVVFLCEHPLLPTQSIIVTLDDIPAMHTEFFDDDVIEAFRLVVIDTALLSLRRRGDPEH